VPSALVAYLLAAGPLAVLAGAAVLVPLALYGLAVTAAAVWIAATLRRVTALASAVLLLVVLHVAYGIGVARGATGRRRPVERPVVLHWHDDRGGEGVVTALAE
jgi:hypothetical protein